MYQAHMYAHIIHRGIKEIKSEEFCAKKSKSKAAGSKRSGIDRAKVKFFGHCNIRMLVSRVKKIASRFQSRMQVSRAQVFFNIVSIKIARHSISQCGAALTNSLRSWLTLLTRLSRVRLVREETSRFKWRTFYREDERTLMKL